MPTEATFLLAGLFIIMAASGWAFKMYLDYDREHPPKSRISADYMRGLNLVLNRRTDEALELFVQMAKVDDDTLETHFALGHLFRRRGEIDRAIRVHQNLLARPNLSEAQRHQALFSLAEDYLSAGLFDRAEVLFSDLAGSPSLGKAALERLLYIYERESEWHKAIDVHRQLEQLTGETSGRIAHYYCELAQQAREEGDLDAARQHLKHTTRTGDGALRGTLIRAGLCEEEGEYAQAARLYEEVIERDRRLLAELLPPLLGCYERLGRVADFDRYVHRLREKDPGIGKDIAYAAILGSLTHVDSLASCVEDFVAHNELLSSLVDGDEMRTADPQQRQRTIDRIAGGLRQLAISSARYRCTNCGYSTRRLIWHCPSCKQWESVRPIQAFQYDALIS
jgi:lipopolysaccharide assembly protein B